MHTDTWATAGSCHHHVHGGSMPAPGPARGRPPLQPQCAGAAGVRTEAAPPHEAVPLGSRHRPGLLEVAPHAAGLVLIAPRLRLLSSRHHRRQLLDALHQRALSTLDLQTPALLEPALRWSAQRTALSGLPVGLWLDLEAAQPALELAARHPARVAAVVVVNPQLQADAAVLPQVHAATLLMQLGGDRSLLASYQRVMAQLHCRKRLESVPLTNPHAAAAGTVEAVAQITSAWMATHLRDHRIL